MPQVKTKKSTKSTKGACIAIITVNECVLPFRLPLCGFVLPFTKPDLFFGLQNHQMEKSSFIPEVRSGFSAASAGLCCLIVSLCFALQHTVYGEPHTYILCMIIYKIPAYN